MRLTSDSDFDTDIYEDEHRKDMEGAQAEDLFILPFVVTP